MLKMRVFWKGFVRGLATPATIFKPFKPPKYRLAQSAEIQEEIDGTNQNSYTYGKITRTARIPPPVGDNVAADGRQIDQL